MIFIKYNIGNFSALFTCWCRDIFSRKSRESFLKNRRKCIRTKQLRFARLLEEKTLHYYFLKLVETSRRFWFAVSDSEMISWWPGSQKWSTCISLQLVLLISILSKHLKFNSTRRIFFLYIRGRACNTPSSLSERFDNHDVTSVPF